MRCQTRSPIVSDTSLASEFAAGQVVTLENPVAQRLARPVPPQPQCWEEDDDEDDEDFVDDDDDLDLGDDEDDDFFDDDEEGGGDDDEEEAEEE